MNLRFQYIYRLFIGIVCFLLVACKAKEVNDTSTTNNKDNYKSNLNANYDWTGTYELKDKDVLYTLKLHKRSVDGSYEMQFYNNTKVADLYKSSIYDAKDDTSYIYIKFLNNFQMDAKPLGFNSGDTLFFLQHINANTDTTVFKSFRPVEKGLKWNKVTENYN